MDNFELENEIELRMNPQDFSLSSGDLIDIMNQYNLSEHDVAFAYSKIVAEKREEILDTTKDVINMFREKGNYYPSFGEFKKMFNQYDGGTFVDDNILRDMHKRETQDANQISMFEIRKMIKEQFREMMEDDDFDKEAAAITKNWGGEIKKSKDAMLSPEDIFDLADAGAVAKQDIQGEFGDDEFVPMSDDEYKAIMRDLSEDLSEDSGVGQQGLFKPQDSQGNDINLKALVSNLEGTKTGRVMGLGDDGKGNLIVRVEWAWPTDMKYMAPEEMGMIPEMPENLIVKGMNEGDGDDYGRSKLRGVEVTYADGTVIPTSMAAHLTDDEINAYFAPGKLFNIGSVDDNMQAVQSVNIIRENMNEEINEEEINEEIADIDASEGDELEEARGLGHTVKNNGDRNVKKSKDNSHAPVTTLPEGKTLDAKIKTLSEGTLKRKDLMNFIREEANNFAKDIKGGNKN